MSDVKTGINPIVVIAGLAVLAALVFGIGPKLRQALDDEDAVIVQVDFLPTPRSGERGPGRTFPDVVSVEINEGGIMHKKETVTTSPYVRVFYPTKVTKFTVTGSQVYGSHIGCVIQRGKTSVDQQRKTGANAAVCHYTFRP